MYRNEQVNSQSQAILNAYNAWNLRAIVISKNHCSHLKGTKDN